MKGRFVRSNLVWYDGQRWYDAFGPNVCKFIDEFTQSALNVAAAGGATNIVGPYTATLVEAGGGGDTALAVIADGPGGYLRITTDNGDGDGANVQVTGESFTFVTAYPTYFGCRFRLNSEVTDNAFLVGLCETDTALIGGMNEGVYFRKADTSTTMNFVLEEGAAETATAFGALVAGTWYTVEFYYDGTTMKWWVNGVQQTSPVLTNLPNAAGVNLTPSFHFLTGELAANTCDIDWIRAIQIQV